MKFAAGVVIGLILGSIAPALAAFYSNFEMSQEPRQFQLGYTAGASDMLGTVDSFAAKEGPARTVQWVHSQAACLLNHGTVLGGLTD